MWEELWVAIALLLVIEGIIPFLNPGAMRKALLNIIEMNDQTLRFAGLTSMLIGVGLLYFIKSVVYS